VLTVEAQNKQVAIKLASSLAEYSLANVGSIVSTGSIPAEDNILVLGVFYQRMKVEQKICPWGARSALFCVLKSLKRQVRVAQGRLTWSKPTIS
jgi:hypothetical protein